MSETIQDLTAEVQRLREHNKQLTSELKSERTDKKTAQEALVAAQSDAKQWRDRWHQSAVIEPLDAALDDASAGPSKYLRAELMDRGILKLQPDADGIDRPTWHRADGEPVELKDGIYRFLVDLNDANINRLVRASGSTGGGATGVHSSWKPEHKPAPAAPSPSFGLR